MKLTSSFFAAAVLSSVVIACAGSSGGVTDGPVSDQTLEAIAGSFCDRLSACYGDFFVKAFIGDTATCKTRLGIELKASARGPGTGLDDAAAKTCKTAVDAAACNAFLSDGVPECDFRGTLADGAACAGDGQCVSGSCFVDAKTDCGKCGARAPEGADCTSAKCARGLTCSDAKKCVKRGAAGAPCDTTSACEVALSCIDGKCGKGLAAGAACKTTATAKDPPCDTLSGLYCKPPSASSADGTCSAFTVVAAGQACGVSLTPAVDYSFCAGSQCVGASGTMKGSCQAYLADGATCTSGGAADCQFPAKCRNGKCATLDPTICK